MTDALVEAVARADELVGDDPDTFRTYAMSLLDYNAETGVFTWKETRNHKAQAGSEAGSINNQGYVHIKVQSRNYKAHRLAWLFETGQWPPACIDHINGRRFDNRIANLRAATYGENQRNAKMRHDNVSGARGVRWLWSHRKWQAMIKINGKSVYLGQFDDRDDAIAARRAAEIEYFKDFSPPTSDASDAQTDTQKQMRIAVAELMKAHRMSERDAASILITITSVVSLAPLTARPKQEDV